MHQELHEGVADHVACAQAEHAKQRQHPERIDQVGYGFGGVVHLHRPTQMHVQLVRCLHHVGGFDQPLATAGWHEEAKHRRIGPHHRREAFGGGDMDEQAGQPMRQRLPAEPRSLGEQRGNTAVQRELDQHASRAGYRAVHCIEETARPPMQQDGEGEEQQVVGVEVGDGQHRRLAGKLVTEPAKAEQADCQ